VARGLAVAQNSPNAAAEPWANLVGTWKQVPGHDGPTTLKVEPEGGGLKFSFGCKQDGSCPDIIIGNYDGKPYKDAGLATWEASFRKTSDQTMQEDGYSSGKLSRTVRWQLSSDGNTLTRTYHDINPPGSKDKDVTYAYDRRGGAISKDDLFIGFWKSDWNKSDVLLTTFAAKSDVLTIMNPSGLTVEKICDGEDHPSKIDATILSSCRFNGPYAFEEVYKKNQKVLFSQTNTVSDDGKKMVLIRKNTDGKTTSERFFERTK
jgi:hypothetical protein